MLLPNKLIKYFVLTNSSHFVKLQRADNIFSNIPVQTNSCSILNNLINSSFGSIKFKLNMNFFFYFGADILLFLPVFFHTLLKNILFCFLNGYVLKVFFFFFCYLFMYLILKKYL